MIEVAIYGAIYERFFPHTNISIEGTNDTDKFFGYSNGLERLFVSFNKYFVTWTIIFFCFSKFLQTVDLVKLLDIGV